MDKAKGFFHSNFRLLQLYQPDDDDGKERELLLSSREKEGIIMNNEQDAV